MPPRAPFRIRRRWGELLRLAFLYLCRRAWERLKELGRAILELADG